MLEQIAELVKHYGQDAVVNNTEVPDEMNNRVMEEATHSIAGGLQSELSGGGLQNIMGLLQGGNAGGNPLVSGIIQSLTANLVSRLNLSPATAGNVANNIIPNVMNTLAHRTQSAAPEDSGFNIGNLISTFTGGQNSPVSSLISQFMGGGNAAQVNPEVAQQVAQHAQQQQESGGLAGLITSFFK